MDIIQPLENANFGEACRACFEACEQYKMLYERAGTSDNRSFGEIFFEVVKIQAKTNIEASPNRICLVCASALINAYDFIQKSLQNHNRLLESLKADSVKQPDCLSESPIDIPHEPSAADNLQIKVESEANNEYADEMNDDKFPDPSSSDSEGSDYEPPSFGETKANKLQCTYCDRIFKRQDFFENHKKKHEEEIKKKGEESEESQPLLCDECEFSCKTQLEMKRHKLANHTDSTISCEREISDSSAKQINSVDKSDDGFFRSQRCPVAVSPHQTNQKDNTDILMLKTEINNLRETCLKEFSEIKALLLQQRQDPVKEDHCKPKVVQNNEESLSNFKTSWQLDKLFPINTDEALNSLNSVDEGQKQQAILTVRHLISQGGFCMNMNKIFGNRIFVNYNYDGRRGKKSLKDKHNVNEILFKAAYTNGYSMLDYENDLRKGFKIMKNRYFKNECIKRKRSDYIPDMLTMF